MCKLVFEDTDSMKMLPNCDILEEEFDCGHPLALTCDYKPCNDVDTMDECRLEHCYSMCFEG